jgi:quinohemoprotein amine dehydrogenase
MMSRLLFAFGAVVLLSTAARVMASNPPVANIEAAAVQAGGGQTPAAPVAKVDEEDGFAITNDVVINTCGSCHTLDDKGRLSRISYRRTTPEGWQETIRRMATLNKAEIDPAAAREIVRYLSDHQGLAPPFLK